MSTDPVALTAALVRCNSITPAEGGALVLLEKMLSAAGFDCTRVDRGGICNLYARWGRQGANRTFGFNGHTDVVPLGNPDDWTVDPFGAEIKDGYLYGRGSTDMKSGVAAFAAAAIDFVQDTPPDGAVVLAITGDEEDVAKDGTVALLDWMQANNEAMSVCLVGEPTCPDEIGDAMKIGRRGSLTVCLILLARLCRRRQAARRNCRRRAAPLMRVLSKIIALLWNSAWRARPCIRSMNA